MEERSPLNLYLVLQRLRPEMSSLIGSDAWNAISVEFDTLLNNLANSSDENERMNIALKLRELLVSIPEAQKRVNQELQWQRNMNAKIEAINSLTNQFVGLDSHDLQLLTTVAGLSLSRTQTDDYGSTLLDSHREIRISKDGSRLVRYKIRLNTVEILKILSGAGLGIWGIATSTNLIPVVLGLLVTYFLVRDGMKTEINIPDDVAWVFCGYVQASGNRGMATEEAMITATNRDRKTANDPIPTLSDADFQHSLHWLSSHDVLEEIDPDLHIWRTKETYIFEE